MMEIEIYFKTGRTADGRNYKVPHTTAWGFDMSVQLNGNLGYTTTPDGRTVVKYDPQKAGIKVNKNGYLTLQIID